MKREVGVGDLYRRVIAAPDVAQMTGLDSA